MLENLNDWISLIALVAIILGTIYSVIKIDAKFKSNDDDEYYRDLL